MSHLLKFTDGKAEMMYVGQAPWHGLGTRLQTAPKTADEAIKAAGLDWEVGLMPLYIRHGDALEEITDRKMTMRLDELGKKNCLPLGYVSNNFKIFQNREAFNFLDPIIATGKVEYHTAGAIGNGERVWVLAKVKGDMLVKGVDRIEKYLLLSNGHDGILPLQVRFTPVRVVCNNTLSAALQGQGDLAYIRHEQNTPGVLDAALNKIFSHFDNLEQQFNKFADFKMDNQKLRYYLASVFPTPSRTAGQSDMDFQRALLHASSMQRRGRQLFEQGMGNAEQGVSGTLWAAYNAVTELVDHHMAYQNASQRLDYIWLGQGQCVKQFAFWHANRLCHVPERSIHPMASASALAALAFVNQSALKRPSGIARTNNPAVANQNTQWVTRLGSVVDMSKNANLNP